MEVDVMQGQRVDRDQDLLDALRRGDPTAPDELVRRDGLVKGRADRARLSLRKRLACGT
jgi:hypothetical protein